MRVIVFSILVSFFSSYSSSQQYTWVDINGLQGFLAFQEGADGKLFAMTTTAVYSSTDDGSNWFQSSINRGEMLSMVARNEKIVVHRFISNLAIRSLAELSTDNGATWNTIFGERQLLYTLDGFAISDSGFIFAIHKNQSGTIAKLVRFNGQTWDTVGTPLSHPRFYQSQLKIDQGNNFYLLLNSGLGNIFFVSTDYGTTWVRNLESWDLDHIGITPNNTIVVGQRYQQFQGRIIYGAVFTSTNVGVSWNYIGLNDQYIESLDGDSAGNIYATAGDIYRYSASTEQWNTVGPPQVSLSALLISSTGAIITSGYSTAVYRTTDKGVKWVPNGPRSLDIFSLMATPSGLILAGTLGNRIFVTASDGIGWSQPPPGSIGDYVYSLHENNSILYAGTDLGLYSSTDDGRNWKNLTSQYFGGSAYSVVTSYTGKIFTGTGFGIYYSSDGGETWNLSGVPDSEVLFMAISVYGTLYAVTYEGSVYRSTDDGATWNHCGLNRGDIQTVVTNGEGDVYLGVFGGVLRSTDRGETWTEHQFATTYVYSLAFNQSQDVFSGTYNGVYISRNNGESWSFLGLNGRPTLALDVGPDQYLRAGLYRGGVMRSEKIATGVDEAPRQLPGTTQLYQNYPNPFNPATAIRFDLVKPGFVELTVFNILGQEVALLASERKSPGTYTVPWQSSEVPSGVYFYRMRVAGEIIDVRKMLLIR